MVGSLPRGMPTVVDESVEVRVKEPDGDTECKRQRLGRFRAPTWRNTLRPVSFSELYCVYSDENEGGPYPPYISRGVGL